MGKAIFYSFQHYSYNLTVFLAEILHELLACRDTRDAH